MTARETVWGTGPGDTKIQDEKQVCIRSQLKSVSQTGDRSMKRFYLIRSYINISKLIRYISREKRDNNIFEN